MPKQLTIKELEIIEGLAESQGTGMPDPMTTRGDMIVRNASNVTARLPVGTAGQVLSTDGTDVSWEDGYTDPMTTRGDMIVRNASNVTARLPVGTNGQVLTTDGTDVSWGSPSAGTGLQLVEEKVLGADAQILDLDTVLAGNTDKYYKLEIRAVAGSGAGGSQRVSLRLNGSNAAGSTIISSCNGSTVNNASQPSNARFNFILNAGGDQATICMEMPFVAAGSLMRFFPFNGAGSLGGSIETETGTMNITSPALGTEITSIGIASAAANGLGAGTTLRLWKLVQ